MGLINKKPEFIAAVCPLCGGNLELDSNFEIARCKECGAESIIRNVNKKKKKSNNIKKHRNRFNIYSDFFISF